MKTMMAYLGVLLAVAATTGATQYVEDFDGAFDPFFNHNLTGSWSLGSTLRLLEGEDVVTFNTAPGDYVAWAQVKLRGESSVYAATVTFVGTLGSAMFHNTQIGVYETYSTEGLALGSIHTIHLDGAIGEFDDLRIYVNQPPVADAGLDQTVTDTDGNGIEQVTLDGSGSSDADGTIESYNWTEGARQLVYSTSPRADVTLTVGIHTITLTVTDDEGATAMDTVVVAVESVTNHRPTANAGPDQTVSWGDLVTLDGSASSDPDPQDELTFLWEYTGPSALLETAIDGTRAPIILDAKTTPVATFPAPKSIVALPFRLTVTDPAGNSATDEVVVAVREDADNAVFVSGRWGDDAFPGTKDLPVSSLRRATVVAAERTPHADIYVHGQGPMESYTEEDLALTIGDDMSLYGGFSVDVQSTPDGPELLWTRSRSFEPTYIHGSTTALQVLDIVSPTTINGFAIESRDGADGSVTGSSGENSVGIYVRNATDALVIAGNIIRAGSGGAGKDGKDGLGRKSGLVAYDPDFDGQDGEDGDEPDSECRAGGGGDSPCGNRGGRGGRGGVPTGVKIGPIDFGGMCTFWQAMCSVPRCIGDGENGERGGPEYGRDNPGGLLKYRQGGDYHTEPDFIWFIPICPAVTWVGENGHQGAPNQLAVSRGSDGLGGGDSDTGCCGSVQDGSWHAGDGVDGANGDHGHGGDGGGGGGGALDVECVWIPSFPWISPVPPFAEVAKGGDGGGGGGGGRGAEGGEGGGGGGASFGIFIHPTLPWCEASPTILDNTIITTAGGIGGNGGLGGSGGRGGQGGKGGPPGQTFGFPPACMAVVSGNEAGHGGDGGAGGYGGNGGHGGGGAGGSSCGIYRNGACPIIGANDYSIGAAGPGGRGEGQRRLFGVDQRFIHELQDGMISEDLWRTFQEHGILLSQDTTLSAVYVEQGWSWLIADGQKKYYIRLEQGRTDLSILSENCNGRNGCSGDICPPPVLLAPGDGGIGGDGEPWVDPEVTVSTPWSVPSGMAQAVFTSMWLGSDVVMTLHSPSGRIIDRDTVASDVLHVLGSTRESYTIRNPEAGQWVIRLFGADVPPEGEQVTLSVTGIETNTPPVAHAGSDQTLDCADVAGARVTLDGSTSSDVDWADELVFEWTNSEGQVVATGSQVELLLPLGVHTLILNVYDGRGGSDTDALTVTVQDTIAPVITVNGADTLTLACGNDEYVELGATATDGCDPNVPVVIGGDTVNPTRVGNYTVTYTATDSSGNETAEVREVAVVPPSLLDCYPRYLPSYVDWLALGKPDCWCDPNQVDPAEGCPPRPQDQINFIPRASITVDGDISEWLADTTVWRKLANVYYGNPLDIVQAEYALCWDPEPNKVYAAVIVTDVSHTFRDADSNWDASDRIQIYSQTGAGGGGSWNGLGDAGRYDLAQQYVIAPDTKGCCWATWGYGQPIEPEAGLEYAVTIAGETIIYEIGVQMFAHYGARSGEETIVAPLDCADCGYLVGFDIVVGSRWGRGVGCFGMLSETATMQTCDKASNAGCFTPYVLVEAIPAEGPSPVAHWTLDETSGGIAHDSMGEHDGTLQGNLLWLPDDGRIGGALAFSGLGDYVEIDDHPDFDLTGHISLAAWIRVGAFDKEWQAILTKGDSAWRIQRDHVRDAIEFACTGLSLPDTWGQILGNVNVNDGQWHHVAGVYDGSTMSLYVDGVLDVSSPASGMIATNDYAVTIGENSEQRGRYWDGLIDDVRIYDEALSAAAIRTLAGF